MREKEKVSEKLYIWVFMLLLIGPWIMWGIVRLADYETFVSLSDVSGENREKAEIDATELLSTGDSLAAFVDDRAPFRNFFIDGYQSVEGKLEKSYRTAFSKVSSAFDKSGDSKKEVDNIDSLFDNTTSSEIVVENNPDTVVEHEHTFSVDTYVEPDCENQGYYINVCTDCGYKEVENIDALGHVKTLTGSSTASYTTYGYNEYVCEVCHKMLREDFEPKLVDTSYLAPSVSGDTVLGRFDWLFYNSSGCISYYRGQSLLDEETLAQRKALVEKLYSICDERGIELHLMIFPNKEQVYSEYMPSYTIDDEYKRVQREVDYINADHENALLYPLQDLKNADAYWQVYSKYDTHWNHMGAFIGMQHLYKVMGMELTNPLEQTVKKRVNTRCDLIILGGLSQDAYPEDYDYIVNYKPEITISGLDVTEKINRVTSTSENDQKLVMLSDSYRELMAPFICKDFKQSVLLHRDYTEACTNDILGADVLIISAVERYDSRLFGNIEQVISIFEQNPVTE